MKDKFLLLVFKEKNLIITGMAAGMLLFAGYMTSFHKNFYSTDAKLFVKNIQKQDVVAAFGGGSSIFSESGFSNPLLNLIQIIQSKKLAYNLYDELQLKYSDDLRKLNINSADDWSRLYSNLIQAKVEPSTDVIKVNFSWINGEDAVDVFTVTINEFKKLNLAITKVVETKQRQYIDTQLVEIGNQLDSIRKRIKDYKINNRATDVINETQSLTTARVDLEKQAQVLKSEIVYESKRVADLSAQLSMPDAQVALRATGIGEDEYLRRLNENLSIAHQNYAKLQAKFTEDYPEVIAAKNEIKSIQDNINSRKKESLGKIKTQRGIYDYPSQQIVTDLARAQATKISLKAQLAALTAGIATLDNKSEQLPLKQFRLQELEKQETALAEAYNSIKQKQLEARIKENEIVDNIVMIDSPSLPRANMFAILVKFIGFLGFGLLAALGIAWIKDDIEDKWTDSSEIEGLTGKRMLGIIPWLNFEEKSSSLVHSPGSILGNAFGNIAFSLNSRAEAERVKAISFVSTNAYRKKSFVVPNIAATLAMMNKSVIVIDTDFSRQASTLKSLNIASIQDKSDILDIIDEINEQLANSKKVDEQLVHEIFKDAVIPVNIESKTRSSYGFNYPCTKKPVNIYEYVSNSGFNEFVKLLKNYYDYILIDTPAKPHILPEFTALTKGSDASVVITSNEKSRKALLNIVRKLEGFNVKVLGIIAREPDRELEEYFNSVSSTKVQIAK